MQTADEAFNAITEKLRTFQLSNEQLEEMCHMLNKLWDAVDAEVRIDELPN